MKISLFPTGSTTFGVRVGDITFWGDEAKYNPQHVVTLNEDGYVETPADIEGLCAILNTLGLITMGRTEPISPVYKPENLTTEAEQETKDRLVRTLELRTRDNLSSIPANSLTLVLTMRAKLLRVRRKAGGYPPWAFHIEDIVKILRQ